MLCYLLPSAARWPFSDHILFDCIVYYFDCILWPYTIWLCCVLFWLHSLTIYYLIMHVNHILFDCIVCPQYDNMQEAQDYFNVALCSMRQQATVFDLGSMLIKPVQRILKYPLFLNQLIKVLFVRWWYSTLYY